MAGPASIISWFLAAAMLGVIALIFAELGSAIPTSGGFARYSHISYGGMTSFIASWLCWLGYVVIPSVETLAILEYLGNEIPWLIQSEGDEPLPVPRKARSSPRESSFHCSSSTCSA